MVQEKEPLPFHSTRAQEIHKAIAEYLNVDMVPFDAVNSSGFLRLMKIMEPRFEVASHTYYISQVEVFRLTLYPSLPNGGASVLCILFTLICPKDNVFVSQY